VERDGFPPGEHDDEVEVGQAEDHPGCVDHAVAVGPDPPGQARPPGRGHPAWWRARAGVRDGVGVRAWASVVLSER
jgi:hypothetical protein